MTKIFTCNLCNKEFSRKQSLKRHLKKKYPCVKKEEVEEEVEEKVEEEVEEEVEEKKIKCEFCEYSTNKTGNLNRHLKTCKAKFKCEFCKKGFANNSSLKRHIKLYCKVKQEEEKQEEDKKRYECIYCHDVMIKKCFLDKHLKFCRKKHELQDCLEEIDLLKKKVKTLEISHVWTNKELKFLKSEMKILKEKISK